MMWLLDGRVAYFLVAALCGLRLVMRPLSVPAVSSITALISVGRPEAMASFSAAVSSCGVSGSDALAAEGFHQQVVARVLDEDGRGGVLAAGAVDVGALVDAVVVEDDHAHRQVVAADRLDLHAAEAEGAVALDRDHRLAGRHGRGDGEAHADAHDAPGAAVQALARLVHVDDAAREVERVGAFVDDDRVGPRLDDRRGSRRARRGSSSARSALASVSAIFDRFLSLRCAIAPVHCAGGLAQPAVDARDEGRDAGADVADQRRGDRHVAVDLGRGDVDLDELLGCAPPRSCPCRARAAS